MFAGRAGVLPLLVEVGRDGLQAGADELAKRLQGGQGLAQQAGGRWGRRGAHDDGLGEAGRRLAEAIFLGVVGEHVGLGAAELPEQHDGLLAQARRRPGLAELGVVEGELPEELGLVLAIADGAGQGQGGLGIGHGAGVVQQTRLHDAEPAEGQLFREPIADVPCVRRARAGRRWAHDTWPAVSRAKPRLSRASLSAA